MTASMSPRFSGKVSAGSSSGLLPAAPLGDEQLAKSAAENQPCSRSPFPRRWALVLSAAASNTTPRPVHPSFLPPGRGRRTSGLSLTPKSLLTPTPTLRKRTLPLASLPLQGCACISLSPGSLAPGMGQAGCRDREVRESKRKHTVSGLQPWGLHAHPPPFLECPWPRPQQIRFENVSSSRLCPTNPGQSYHGEHSSCQSAMVS